MAKVSLRIYTREIETLIDQGHLDEAVAHCRHILQTFSKHLETYRLLGKAYLESKRYEEAVDVFSRVLMAVPDDFVSHVGMSIVRDDQGKLDDAIWHMERAFEAQPSNAAIQSELQRLFGRRDGVEPAKVRMTRGALAHMYVQGELYPQAISEIKAVLAQDSQRDDMKVLLARAYFHAGQKADASDVCSQLLKRYPYSFDANRIMVELLQGSDSVENTQVYRHRVNELDPYAAFAPGSVFRSNEVSDAAVSLERLDYRGPETQPEVDWGRANLGVGSSTPAQEPDWLRSGYPAAAEEQPAAPAEPSPDIPDFMRQAGWVEASGAAEEPVSFEAAPETPGEADLAPAEMPDWLKAMVPTESEEPAPAPSTTEGPDWLTNLRSEAPSAAQNAEIPDWLSSLESVDTGAAPSSQEAAAPDWLQPAPEPIIPTSEPVPPPPAEEPPVTPPVSALASLDTLGKSAQEQDDALAWLESLAAKHGAKSEELVSDPSLRTEKPPEWVEQARALGEAAAPAPQVIEPASEPEPELPTEQAAAAETGPWMEEFAAPSDQPIEPVAEAPALAEPEPEVQAPPMAPAEPREPAADETGIWLRGLAEKEAAGQTEQADIFAAESAEVGFTESSADLADWLSKLDAQVPKAEEIPTSAPIETPPPAGASDLPDWLRGLDEEEKWSSSSALSDELPAWLQGEPEPPAQPERAAPTDWHPLQSEGEVPPSLEPQPVPEPMVQAEPEPEPEPHQEPEAPIPSQLQPEPVSYQQPEAPSEPYHEPATPVEPQPEPPSEVDLNSQLQAEIEMVREEELPAEPEIEPELPAEVEIPPSTELPVALQSQQPSEPQQPAPEPPVQPQPEPYRAPEPPQPAAAPAPRKSPPARPAAPRPPTGTLAPLEDPVLSTAHSDMKRGDIPAALENYGRLIRRGKFLEEIIRDLRDALYRYPIEVTIWQTLGDAYMRENRLQEALDAYTKAEELLR